MEDLDLDGLFWPEDAPDNQVAGRLTFDARDGGLLALIGSFDDLDQFGELGGPTRIHGLAGKRVLTLDGCLQIGKTFEMPGFVRERYHVPRILSGEHLRESQFDRFTAVHIGLRHLEHWVNKSGTKFDTELSEGPDGPIDIRRVTVTHEPLDAVIAPIAEGTLEIGFPSRMSLNPFEARITQDCSFAVRFDKQVGLREALARCTALQDLMTIGLDEPAAVKHVSLSHADSVSQRSDGEPVNTPIELHAQFHGSRPPEGGGGTYPANMLFTFEDIGGLDGVAQWLSAATRFRAVIGLLMSHWYIPEMYTENHFLNVIIAAEALERIRTGKQETPARRALLKIADDAGQIADVLVGDVKSWADEVVKMRAVDLVHTGLGEDPGTTRMHYLSGSVYMLVVVSLLRECGVSVTTLSNIQHHRRFKWVAEGLRTTT